MAIDWRARRKRDEPLDAWEVLAEEFEEAGNPLGDVLDAAADAYFAAKNKLDERRRSHQKNRCNRCLAEAQAAFDAALRAVEKILFSKFHEKSRTALCFSGGGVRSATFGLGVLHGLARLDPSPLPEFDYLSTVSGGGYLGAWFSAWAAHKEQASPAMTGAEAVKTELAMQPPLPSTLDPEPAPLRHIRKYCRFLNPRMGLLSADTWTLVATVIRNMILNWLILIPLLMAVLLIPMVFNDLIRVFDNIDDSLIYFHPIGVWLLLLAGVLTGAGATGYIACHLPSLSHNKAGTETNFLRWCLVPLGISAICLSIHWIWRLRIYPNNDYAPIQYMGIGASIHFLGGLLGVIVMLIWSKRKRGAKTDGPNSAKRIGFWGVVLVLLTAAVSGAVAGGLAYLAAQWLLDHVVTFFACLAVPFVLLAFSAAALLTVGLGSQLTDDEDREWWSRAGGWLLILTVVWVVFSASVLYLPTLLKDAVSRLIAAVSTLGIGGIASRLGFSGQTAASGLQGKGSREQTTSPTKDLIAKIAGPVFLLLLVGVLGILNTLAAGSLHVWPVTAWLPGVSQPIFSGVYLMAFDGLLVLVFAWPININRFSLHAMYRARLVRTYLGASRPDRVDTANQFTDLDEADNLPMADLSRNKPLHLVNMALNLVGGENLAWQQRKAESFTASRLRTGSMRVGYQNSATYAKQGGAGKGFTLGSAITISGAAASPNMGYHSSPILSFVMTLFNARLGWWLANPGPKGEGRWHKDGPTLSFTPILNEALGRTNDDSPWVYLSDGGHFENLGIYEMIVRRCKTIVVVDGSEDKPYTFEDLGNAVRKVRVDLGIPIEFTTGLPMFSGRDVRNLYCAIGTIDYRCVDGFGVGKEDRIGTILYIKACLNGSEPTDVLHYASSDEDFPQQGTEQLWFDEAQFESYRRLGSHVAEQIGGKIAPPQPDMSTVEQFVEAAKEYIKARPPIKFNSWPRPSKFAGSAEGELAGASGAKGDLKLTFEVEES